MVKLIMNLVCQVPLTFWVEDQIGGTIEARCLPKSLHDDTIQNNFCCEWCDEEGEANEDIVTRHWEWLVNG